MIGTKIDKPIEDFAEYTELAKWCQSNGAMIADKGEYYECVREPEPMQPAEPQEPHIDEERIALYEAMAAQEARIVELEAALKGGEGK